MLCTNGGMSYVFLNHIVSRLQYVHISLFFYLRTGIVKSSDWAVGRMTLVG